MHCAYCLTQCTKLKNLEKNTFRILTWKNNRLISIIKLETKVSWYFVTKIVLTYCENFFLNSRLSCSWRFHGFSNKSEQLYWDLETWRKIFRFALSFHISKLDLRFQKKNQMDFQVLGMILLLRIMLASICIQNNKITISKETRPKSILHQLPLTKGGPSNKKKRLLSPKKSHLAVLCIERTTIGCYDFVQIDFNQLERILPNGKISIFKVILLVQTMQVFLKLILS